MTADARPRIVTGTRIGHYEIVGWLGAGGMARSTALVIREYRLDRSAEMSGVVTAFARLRATSSCKRLQRIDVSSPNGVCSNTVFGGSVPR